MTAEKVHEIDSRPVRVGLVYRKGSRIFDRLSPMSSTLYRFWRHAMDRCQDIDMVCVPTTTMEFDLKELEGRVDVVVLCSFIKAQAPDKLYNTDTVETPIVYIAGDAHSMGYGTTVIRPGTKKVYNARELAQQYGVDLYMHNSSMRYARKYHDDDDQVVSLMCGVESSWYAHNPEWSERHPGIVLSGVRIKGAKTHGPHYTLRCNCKDVPGVVCVGKSEGTCGARYATVLHKYRAGIAACTTTPVQKYLEIPAAGCLTFCEVTEQNGAEETGLIDGVHCVYITPDNYREKMEEYRCTSDDDRWRRIANAGRDFVLRNHTTDVAASKFALIAKELVRAGRGNRMDTDMCVTRRHPLKR